MRRGVLSLRIFQRMRFSRDGDQIVTSNISSRFLPGLLIGYAADITMDSNRVTQSGYLIPAAQFDTLQEVLVITDLKSEMSEGGSGDGRAFLGMRPPRAKALPPPDLPAGRQPRRRKGRAGQSPHRRAAGGRPMKRFLINLALAIAAFTVQSCIFPRFHFCPPPPIYC